MSNRSGPAVTTKYSNLSMVDVKSMSSLSVLGPHLLQAMGLEPNAIVWHLDVSVAWMGMRGMFLHNFPCNFEFVLFRVPSKAVSSKCFFLLAFLIVSFVSPFKIPSLFSLFSSNIFGFSCCFIVFCFPPPPFLS